MTNKNNISDREEFNEKFPIKHNVGDGIFSTPCASTVGLECDCGSKETQDKFYSWHKQKTNA